MAALRYRKFLKLCEMWPVDETKVAGNRDFGKHLRKGIAIAFSKGEMSSIADEPSCDDIYESLYRIASDHHRKNYSTSRNFTATGCCLEDLRQVTSSHGLETVKDEAPAFRERFSWFKDKED